MCNSGQVVIIKITDKSTQAQWSIKNGMIEKPRQTKYATNNTNERRYSEAHIIPCLPRT